jgi:galactokinase
MSLFRAPGRVNLIGEHTDYNLGFVLPIALDLVTEVGFAYYTKSAALLLTSEGFKDSAGVPIVDLPTQQPEHKWTDYVVGVAQQLLKLGFPIEPAFLSFHSTVPEGAGLSSSAALEVSAALALLNGRPIDPLELAKLCQRAEREFVGVPSGIMDQYVSVFGRRDNAVLIDCRSLTHQYVPLPPETDLEIWAVNSMVKHALGNSAYKERVAECAAAAKALNVASLRDATLPQLNAASLPDLIYRRAKHVITENARVQAFVTASLPRRGELFLESHQSMRDDYEISCAEIDFLVETARHIEGCYGARMTGGGFGGCTVNLLEPTAVPTFQQAITEAYEAKFQITPNFIRCRPSNGAVTPA